MSEIQVKTGKDETAKVVTVSFDFPTSVAGFVEKYGEQQTHNLLVRSATLAIQALVRQKVNSKDGATDEQLQAAVNGWAPGTRAPATKKTAYERAESALDGLTEEELARIIKERRARKG